VSLIPSEGRAVGPRTSVNTAFGYRTSAVSADLEPYSAPVADAPQHQALAGEGSWHPMTGLPASMHDDE
jgi:hypothetical protein